MSARIGLRETAFRGFERFGLYAVSVATAQSFSVQLLRRSALERKIA
jgi:hypothetical protein